MLTVDVLRRSRGGWTAWTRSWRPSATGAGPDRTKFDALQHHLLNVGIEKEMASGDDGPADEDDQRE